MVFDRAGNFVAGLKPDQFVLSLSGEKRLLATMIPFAIGTGARKSEQLSLKVRQCDFFAT